MNTMIISAFPACGKTYLYKNQETLTFKYLGKEKSFTFQDSESSKYSKDAEWEKRYVDDIVDKLGSVDFIFISQHENVLAELKNRHIPFVVIAPNNSKYTSDKERQLTKQQWFGRFILRDNSHIRDINGWLNFLKCNYDEWTSFEHLTKYEPVATFLLNENQYLSDVIEDLYWKKEKYTDSYCFSKI